MSIRYTERLAEAGIEPAVGRQLATLEWAAWLNHHRLLEPIGSVPPAEAEANDYRQFAGNTLEAI